MNGPALYHTVKVWAWLDWYTRVKLVLRKMLSLAFDAFSEAMELLEIAEKRLRRLAMMRLGVGRWGCFFLWLGSGGISIGCTGFHFINTIKYEICMNFLNESFVDIDKLL